MTATQPRRGRPPVSSREAVEAVAFRLLLEHGYAATTVQQLIEASGVGRTTFFRYFGSKAGIVWGEFDRAIERLSGAFAQAGDVPAMTAVRDAVVESTRLSRDASPETWLDRFRVLDRDPDLIAETAAHWRAWSETVRDAVAARTGRPVDDEVCAAVGGAVQAVYVVILRRWAEDDLRADVGELSRALTPIADALQTVLDTIPD